MPQGLRTAWVNCATVNFAPGEIGTERALALGAVAIPALRLGPRPQFHRLGMIATLRGRKIVARCKHDDGGKIFLHGDLPYAALFGACVVRSLSHPAAV